VKQRAAQGRSSFNGLAPCDTGGTSGNALSEWETLENVVEIQRRPVPLNAV
jgi:hypothetical protein